MKFYLVHDIRTGKPVQVVTIPAVDAPEFEDVIEANPRLWAVQLSGFAKNFALVGALQEIAEANDDD